MHLAESKMAAICKERIRCVMSCTEKTFNSN